MKKLFACMLICWLLCKVLPPLSALAEEIQVRDIQESVLICTDGGYASGYGPKNAIDGDFSTQYRSRTSGKE